MAKKTKRKWSHFESGDGKKKSKSAMVDGYSFGDRLLEGVMFVITIQEDGTLKADVELGAKPYFDGLNKKKWLKAALNEAEETDVFYATDGSNTDYVLKDTEGKLNYDDGTPPVQPIMVKKTNMAALFKNINKHFGTPEQD